MKEQIEYVQENIFWRIRERDDGTESRSLYIRYYNPAKGYTTKEHIKSGLENDAGKLLRTRLKQNDDGEKIVTTSNRTRMKELFDAVVVDYKNEEQRSLDKVERMLKKYLRPAFDLRRASTINRADLERYKSERRIKAKKSTVNRELSVLIRGFNLGVRLKLIPKSSIPDLTGLRMDESDNVREGFFEQSDFLKHYAYLPDYLKPISEMGYTFGQRKQELLSMLWKQVNRVDCVITLGARQTKNKKIRTIHYGKNPEIKDLIDRQWKLKLEIEHSHPRVKITHVFFHADGRPVKDFRGAWDTACEKSKIDRTFHDLRRTAVRNMVRAGIPKLQCRFQDIQQEAFLIDTT